MGKIKKKDNDNNSIKNLPPFIVNTENQTKQNINTEKTKNRTSENTSNQPKYFWLIWIKNEAQTIANIISFLMFIATVFLAIYTFGIFNKTSIQTDNAIKSAKAAITADSLSKVALDSANSYRIQDIASQKKADFKKSKREDSIFDLQKKRVNAQIASLKQQNDFFKKENEPILQLGVINDWKIEDLDYFQFSFDINNLSKRVIKIINKKENVFFIRQDRFIDSINFVNNPFNKNTKIINENSYVNPGTPYTKLFKTPFPIPIGFKNSFFSESHHFFIAESFEYINYITNKKRVYFFIVKIFPEIKDNNGKYGLRIQFIKNENYDIN